MAAGCLWRCGSPSPARRPRRPRPTSCVRGPFFDGHPPAASSEAGEIPVPHQGLLPHRLLVVTLPVTTAEHATEPVMQRAAGVLGRVGVEARRPLWFPPRLR